MSEGFTASWLDLREPIDAGARDRTLLERLAAWRRERHQLHVLDLGSGTGANLRRTAPVLGEPQSWTLVEHDSDLIRAGEARLAGQATEWHYRHADLAQELESLGDEPVDLLTASALLDLASVEWLDRLVSLRRLTGAALYLALTFDGRIEWEPVDPFDAPIAGLINRHQRTDKGFGPALGPSAPGQLAERLALESANVAMRRSDWTLRPEEVEVQVAMLDGHASASHAIAPEYRSEIARWRERRHEAISDRRSRLRVGHVDLLMLP